MQFAEELVLATSLDSFLVQEKQSVHSLFKEYYQFLKENGFKRVTEIEYNVDKPGTKSFLRAARLHPNTKFYLVNRILPGQKRKFAQVPTKLVNPKKTPEDDFFFEFENVTGQKVSGKSILTSFADEPDWGMDHELWPIQEYGYGEIPYGKPEGEASKAAFHMQFQNEGILIRKFVPGISDGMVKERVELFSRLSKLAFEKGHPYWGYRFSSWAAHYIQDLSQPYHSKALPTESTKYYLSFLFKSAEEKKQFVKDTTQLLTNRHFLYEDFISNALEKSYTTKDTLYSTLVSYLRDGDATYTKIKTPIELIEKIGSDSYGHAKQLDESITETFGPKLTLDPKYELDKDYTLNMTQIVNSLDKEKKDLILEEAGQDFLQTGISSRTIILLNVPKK